MASPVPVKSSQPLHNFTLPQQLTWNKDGASSGANQRRRSAVKSPSPNPNSSSSSPIRRSTSRENSAPPPVGDSAPREVSAKPSPIRGESSAKNSPPLRECVKHARGGGGGGGETKKTSSAVSKDSQAAVVMKSKDSRSSAFYSIKDGAYKAKANPEKAAPKQAEKKPKPAKEIDETKSSKILIKLPGKKNAKPEEEKPLKKVEVKDDNNEAQDEDKNNSTFDEDAKIWNLRPRKPFKKPKKTVAGGSEKGKAPAVPEKNKSQSPPAKSGEKAGNSGGGGEGSNGGGGGDKKQKRKLSISIALTKQEIEEDIYALTGGKPSRRPRKRSKIVQKHVDVRTKSDL